MILEKISTYLDLDSLLVLIIGVSNFINIDFSEIVSFFLDPKTLIGYLDDFLRLAISGFSVLILYKKYKKIK